MGQRLTFDEAVATWRTLTDPETCEGDWDGSLLRACETMILGYPVATHAQAAAVCAVLPHGTYGREATALDELVRWLQARSGDPLAGTSGTQAETT